MAKKIDSGDADDESAKMDDDSLASLAQVKKGKSLNFVLSMKGGDVRSLVVKKKAIKDSERKEARGGGYQPIFGVVTGSGANIKFFVARTDGFDETTAATRTDKLKKFLKDQSGNTFNPSFELVDNAPPIPFDDEDLKDPLIARFMQLQVPISDACTQFPESIPQIQAAVNAIRLLLQDDVKRPEAARPIDALVELLKGLAAGKTAGTPPTSTDARPDEGDAEIKARLVESLQKLRPLMDQVINAQPGLKEALFAKMAQIADAIRRNEFDQAKQSILGFAAELKTLLAQPPTSQTSTSQPPGSTDLEAQYASLRQELEPRLLEAQKLDREKATKLGAVWDYAGQQASSGNFRNALNALEKLRTAITDVIKTAPSTDAERYSIPTGIVAERKRVLEDFFSKQLEQARTDAEMKMKEFEPTFAEVINESQDLLDAINEDLRALYDDFQLKLSEALSKGSYDDVARTIETCREQIASNELLTALSEAKSDLEVDIAVTPQFDQLLNSFQDKLRQLQA